MPEPYVAPEYEIIDIDARKRLDELEDIVTDLQMRLDKLDHVTPPAKGK